MLARPKRRLVALALLAAVVIGGGTERSVAQMAAGSAPEPAAGTPAEEEALDLLSEGLHVSARTKAEEILADDRDSVVGHYVLGRAMFEAEGSLARAMFHLGRAREVYEQERSLGPKGTPFHQELLYQTARLAGQMELYEFQLELLGYHDHRYDPDLIAERCWPLMKLGRMQQAREFAQTAVGSPNPWQVSAGLNALCAVEGEARSREPYYEACERALESAREEAAEREEDAERKGGGIAVDAYNAALGAAAALRLQEAEELAREGAERFEPTPANPWRLLVELHLSEGEMRKAIDAFASMVRWNDRTPASLRDQSRADIEATVAMVMLHAGRAKEALVRIDRALARPDRRGLTTDGALQARGRHALLRRIIERTRREQAAERASWEGTTARMLQGLSSIPETLAAVPDEERIVAVMTTERRLIDTVRPYVPGGIDGLSPWLTGELVDVLGPAVVSVAIDRARERDEDDRAEPMYLALEAEVAAARGDEREALRIAERALPELEEPGWALVRARLAAVTAEAAESAGRDTRANELYAMALQTDPTVFRRLGLAIPVRVTGSGGDAAEAAELLAGSPRFREQRGAFTLRVTDTGEGLRGCLRSAKGNELRCAEVRPPEPEPAKAEDDAQGKQESSEAEEPPSLPEQLAREVHRQLFSARISLSKVDLSSLDGHVNGGSALANERLRDLMAE